MFNLKITTAIIEKDAEELKKLSTELKKINELSVIGTATKIKTGASIIINYSPDLVFVNIDLDNIGGIEFVRSLRNRNIFTEIVFLATNKHNAFKSLEVEPFDFLVKPIQKEDVQKMLVRLKTKLKKKELYRKMNIFTNSNSLPAKRVFNQNGGIIIVDLDEIVFCKAELTTTILALKSGEMIKLKSRISDTIEIINSENFVRTGRSYCINKLYLRKIDKRHFKCQLYHEGQTWEVPTSKNTIVQLEKLNVSQMY